MPAHALVLADIHASPTLQAVQYGKDTPFSLLNETLQSAAEELPSPALLLILGDLVAHHARTESDAARTFTAVASSIHRSFPSLASGGCAVAVGNNDVYPDYAVPSTLSRQGIFYEAQAEAVRDLCSLDVEAFESLRSRGFYATQPSAGLQLAVLNTDIYSPNARVGLGSAEARNATDPLGQFEWLEQRLAHAASTGGRVLILGHIPPMVDEYARTELWMAQFAHHYWWLVRRHADQVAGQLFGHVHSDEFRVWRGADGAQPSANVRAPRSSGGSRSRDDSRSGDSSRGGDGSRSGGSSVASAASASTDAIDAAPPLMTFGSVSPIFGNNPAFYTMELDLPSVAPPSNATREHEGSPLARAGGPNASAQAYRPKQICAFYSQLGASPPMGYRLMYRSPGAYGLRALSNREYTRLGAAFAASDGAVWEAWFRNYKLRSDDPRVLSHPTCDAADADAGFCANCTGGCRLAFSCLLSDGTSDADYGTCLTARGLRPPVPVLDEVAAVATSVVMMGLLVTAVAFWSRLRTCGRAVTVPTAAAAMTAVTEVDAARTLDSVMPVPAAREMQSASSSSNKAALTTPLAAADAMATQAQSGGAFLG